MKLQQNLAKYFLHVFKIQIHYSILHVLFMHIVWFIHHALTIFNPTAWRRYDHE